MNKSPEPELLKKSKVFCMLPWTSLSVRPEGNVFPCCIAPLDDMRFGNLHESSLEDVWNSPRMLEIRRNMLAGKPTALCSTCYELEDAGLRSYRIEQNERLAKHIDKVKQTAPDGRVDKLHMAYMDIRFSNLCNFKCRYCGPWLSTSWYDDYNKAPHFESPWTETKPLTPTDKPEQLLEQIEAHLPNVEYVYFSGGEPLMQKEHYRVLQMLEERKQFQVQLIYNTNFSVTTHAGRDIFDIWKKFDSVQVCASLDAMGARGEYLRKNQKWDQVVESRRRMLSAAPRVNFSIFPTLTVMNSLHLPEFHREWLRLGFIGPEDIFINMMQDLEHFRVQILPKPLKEKVAKAYEDHIKFLSKEHGAKADRAAAQFKGILEFMWAKDLSHLVGTFRQKTAELDKVRGERFQDVFPEFASLMES